MKVLIICIGIIFFLALILIGIYLEKKDFNNGMCPYCNFKLRHYDTNSQGGRGYMCDKCHYDTWVSYNCVDKDF